MVSIYHTLTPKTVCVFSTLPYSLHPFPSLQFHATGHRVQLMCVLGHGAPRVESTRTLETSETGPWPISPSGSNTGSVLGKLWLQISLSQEKPQLLEHMPHKLEAGNFQEVCHIERLERNVKSLTVAPAECQWQTLANSSIAMQQLAMNLPWMFF